MKKDIDWDAINEYMSDPTLFYQGEELEARNDAALKKALGVTGPSVKVVDLPNGTFRLDIDFDNIVQRGRDAL